MRIEKAKKWNKKNRVGMYAKWRVDRPADMGLRYEHLKKFWLLCA